VSGGGGVELGDAGHVALALERGSHMQAPLGWAVIGVLVKSTFATVPILPSVFAIVTGKRKPQFPSIYPDDPDSVQMSHGCGNGLHLHS
jgi:hypothetical protein